MEFKGLKLLFYSFLFLLFCSVPKLALCDTMNYSPKMTMAMVDHETNGAVTPSTKNVDLWLYLTNTNQTAYIYGSDNNAGIVRLILYPMNQQTPASVDGLTGPFYQLFFNRLFNSPPVVNPGQTLPLLIGTLPVSKITYINGTSSTSITSLPAGLYMPFIKLLFTYQGIFNDYFLNPGYVTVYPSGTTVPQPSSSMS